MLIEEALRNATDEQIKSEWARRTQAMRKIRGGGRKPKTELPPMRTANKLIPVNEVPTIIMQIAAKATNHDYKNCRIYKCGMCAARKA